MPQLQDKVTAMKANFKEISEKLKANERRLKTLDKHIEQAQYFLEFKAIYKQYKQQKPKKQEAFREAHRREITLYEVAERYLDKHMNGHVFSAKTLKAWKLEKSTLTAERDGVYREYVALREEMKLVETIKRNVGAILREDVGEAQPKRIQGTEI
jgi:tRNA G18 (ribose-2'-O)-methylase SpoU